MEAPLRCTQNYIILHNILMIHENKIYYLKYFKCISNSVLNNFCENAYKVASNHLI